MYLQKVIVPALLPMAIIETGSKFSPIHKGDHETAKQIFKIRKGVLHNFFFLQNI
jgi:hypothetical protein